MRAGQLDGLQTSSLMNDLGYASRIIQSLRNVLMIGQGQGLFSVMRTLEDEGEGSLIELR